MPEKADISLRGIAAGAAIIAAGMAFSLSASLIFFRQEGPVAPPAVSGPVLQIAPRQDLAAYLREKSARLRGIERAMRELAR